MKHISLLLFTLLLCSCAKQDCGDQAIDLQACFDENIEYTQSDKKYRDYIDNRTMWECLDIQDYEVTYETLTQACPGGILRLRVEDGIVVELMDLPSQNPYIHQSTCIGMNINKMFYLIQYAVDSSKVYEGQPIINPWDSIHYVAHESNIKYDPIYHFPDSIYIDINGAYQDDEFMAIFYDFEEIK